MDAPQPPAPYGGYTDEAEEPARPFTTLKRNLDKSLHAATWTGRAMYIFRHFQGCLIAGSAISFLLLLCEVLMIAPEAFAAIELSMARVTGVHAKPRPRCRLKGPRAPSVSVLVTACGEDTDIVKDTFTAAAIQSYPQGCHQVFVLDDGKSSDLEQAVGDFNERQGRSLGLNPVVYIARMKERGAPHHYKSGNLRHGIAASSLHGRSEFFAALDADMIVEHDWLSRIVPHILNDAGVALVSPSQLLYNVPKDDALAQQTNVFQGLTEPLRDRHGSSPCSGSGYIMRREALNSIGG